jgi:HD-like signal output (HDOD) protein
MKPDHDASSAGKAPVTSGLEQPQTHPFVARLLELGATRRPPVPPPADAAARPLVYRVPDTPASLAEITPPPLPQVFLALRRTAQNPMSTTAEMANVISKDPGLAAYVLRLANSALYAPSATVETVSRAVASIGLSEIETMAAAALVGRLFERPPRADVLSMPDFWRHAVAVAMLSRNLGKRVGDQSGERLFVAGLLHDLGRLMLAMAEPDLAAGILARATDHGIPLNVAERMETGFDHADLCGRICAKWRLSDQLVAAVACHHVPSQCLDNFQASAVHLADFMANALGFRATPTAALPVLDVATLALFDLEAADPQPFLDLLEEDLAAMASLFAP